MASPFRVFRRHQKALLIVAGVVLMLVFVLADSLQMLMGSGTGGADGARPDAGAVAVRWNGGSLTNAELSELVFRRRVLNSFLRALAQQGFYNEQITAASRRVQPRQEPNVELLLGPETTQQGVERDVVRVRLYADAAKDTGMVVSDEIIGHYLDEVGFGHVTRDQMSAMIRNIQVGPGSTPTAYVFEALREELLASNFHRSHAFASSTVLPEQRWRDWLRINDRVSIEAAAFPAERFLVDVPEPTDADLIAFLERKDSAGTMFKDREPLPDLRYTPELPSPFPGFKIPRKIDVQYVRADFNKLLEQLKSEVTEEEIQKYYDENKDPYFIKADTSAIDKPAAELEAAQPDGAQETATTTPGNSQQADADANSGKTLDATEAKQESPAISPPTTPSDATSVPNDDGKSALRSGGGIFRLAAFQQPETDSPQDAQSDALPAQTTPPNSDPAAGAPASAQPADAPATPLAQPGADAAAAAQGDAATGAQTLPVEAKKPLEFQPLDEVRDEIRRQLATPKVHSRLDELVSQIETTLNNEFNKFFTQLIDAQTAKTAIPSPPPELVDFAALAERHGLEYRRTGPMSAIQLRDDETIGKLLDMNRLMTMQQQVPIYSILFSKESDLYKPISTDDLDNNRYILMKVGDTPERVPPLAEIRDDVARAWRLDKASEVAKKAADEAAEKADLARTTLENFFADQPDVNVVRTDSFAEFTAGDVPLAGGQYRLSAPENIVAAGPDFLRAVFELEEGAVTAVFNHDHSIAYVIRLAERANSPEKLREMYLAEANTWPGLAMMQSSRVRTADMVLANSIWQDAGVEEVRRLDPPETEED